MNRLNHLFLSALFISALFLSSCKSKKSEVDNTPPATITADTGVNASAAPVIISGDEQLKKGVEDAMKDYSTIKAEVIDSVINLSGEIKRTDWQKLNPTLNSLHPKRVNSTNLTIR